MEYSDIVAGVAFNGGADYRDGSRRVEIEDWGSGYGSIAITNRADFEAFVRGLRRAADAAFGESEF